MHTLYFKKIKRVNFNFLVLFRFAWEKRLKKLVRLRVIWKIACEEIAWWACNESGCWGNIWLLLGKIRCKSNMSGYAQKKYWNCLNHPKIVHTVGHLKEDNQHNITKKLWIQFSTVNRVIVYQKKMKNDTFSSGWTVFWKKPSSC